jgi:ethanolamine ammonia-lyase small subunit
MNNHSGEEVPQVNNNKSCHPERSGTKWSEVEGSAVAAISAAKRTPANAPHTLTQLRRFTPARIALGRTGNSLRTKELLEFTAAHALARDAVQAPFDVQSIAEQLNAANLEVIQVHSAAADKTTYLRRPDLGRKLDEPSRNRLAELRLPAKSEVVFIVADGLSAIAPMRYAVPVVKAVCELLEGWQIGPVVIAEQSRVALGDEIGQLLGAEMTVMLIGERPGLSSPDSLGIYLTYAPRIGRTDAERNCISNVRNDGINPEHAAETLRYLLTSSRQRMLSGVQLKDESDNRSANLTDNVPYDLSS